MFCLWKVPNLVWVSSVGSDMTSVLSQGKVFKTAMLDPAPFQERIPVIHKQQEEVLTLWCVSLKIWSSLDHLMMQSIGHTTGTGSGGDLMNHQDPIQLMFDFSYFVVFQHIISLLLSFTHPHVIPNPTWRDGMTGRMFTHLFSICTIFQVFSSHTTLVMLPSKVA